MINMSSSMRLYHDKVLNYITPIWSFQALINGVFKWFRFFHTWIQTFVSCALLSFILPSEHNICHFCRIYWLHSYSTEWLLGKVCITKSKFSRYFVNFFFCYFYRDFSVTGDVASFFLFLCYHCFDCLFGFSNFSQLYYAVLICTL